MPDLKKNTLNDLDIIYEAPSDTKENSKNESFQKDGIQLLFVQKMEDNLLNNFDDKETGSKNLVKEDTKVVSFANSTNIIPDHNILLDTRDKKDEKRFVKKSWVYSYNLNGDNSFQDKKLIDCADNDGTLESLSDSDSEKNRTYRYSFGKAKLTYKKLPLKKVCRYASNHPPSIQKTYNIGKNRKLNIRMSYPMSGILNRECKSKNCKANNSAQQTITKSQSDVNDVQKNQKASSSKALERKSSFISPIFRQKRELLKDVLSKRNIQKETSTIPILRNKSRSIFNSPVPPPPQSDQLLTGEEDSEESFRTFVLETSVYENFEPPTISSDRLMAKKADVGKMLISSSPAGDQKLNPSRRKFSGKKDIPYRRFKPFQSMKYELRSNSTADNRAGSTKDRELKEEIVYDAVQIPKPDYDAEYTIPSWNCHQRYIAKKASKNRVADERNQLRCSRREMLSKVKDTFDFLRLTSSGNKITSDTRREKFSTGNVKGSGGCTSNVKTTLKISNPSSIIINKQPYQSFSQDIYSTDEPHLLSYTSVSAPKATVAEKEAPAYMRKSSQIQAYKKNIVRSVSYTTNKDPSQTDTAKITNKNFLKFADRSASPKPSKSILKKPNIASALPTRRSTNPQLEENSGCGVPLSPLPAEIGSQPSSTTESDSGLECDPESQEDEGSKGGSPVNGNCPLANMEQVHPTQEESRNSPKSVLRGWKQKYEVLLGLVKEPGRLLPDILGVEVRALESRRHRLMIERSLLKPNLDSWETMGGAKGRRVKDRPESIRSLYEQVANLDCMLTSLETQIEVLSSVQDSLPKEFHAVDTFHDSGTSGHEPDSLEAIETLVGGKAVTDSRVITESSGSPGPEGTGNGPGGRPGDAAVLLHLERCAHRQTRRILQETKQKYQALQQDFGDKKVTNSLPRSVGSDIVHLHIEDELNLNSLESLHSTTSSERLMDELKARDTTPENPSIKILYPSPYLTQLREMTISQLRMRVLQLEKARLDKVPLDAAKEISRLNVMVIQLEKARDEITLQNFTLKSRLAEVTSKINDPAATYQINKESSLSIKENIRPESSHDEEEIQKILRKSTYKVNAETQKLRQMYSEFGATEERYKKRISELETELRNQQNAATEKFDHHIRNLENQLEATQKKVEITEQYLLGKDEECNMVKLDFDTINEENKRLKEQLNDAIRKQQELSVLATKCIQLENELTKLEDENRLLIEDFNRERVLRKKYYNQIEEMKGKIRVFCRLRPFTELEKRAGGDEVTKVEDEFSLLLGSSRGPKTFLFDRVFTQMEGQEEVFEDTRALIQSALDGYNVTIMAYGQTGSGKTYTMLGTEAAPGIAPRAFSRIFQMVDEGKSRQDISVSAYMLELYNDKLIDLLKYNGYSEPSDKLDVKRDKKGSVYVSGAIIKNVSTAEDLMKVFEEGLSNRHTASTKMNLSSSRSHLLITVLLTITSKQTGSVLKGKLTLVDLAGSERVQKSGASADQLKEANSINKSLSALGDVISALSSESSFVPYRNSKLTMLLQDSIGGNAKTLVFVNISPAAFNCEESLVSLMYASRIKQITNNACKNADNKEISRLKMIISKLKKGEDTEDD